MISASTNPARYDHATAYRAAAPRSGRQFAARTRMPHGDARWVTIAPVAGLFRPYPHPGFLEPIDEGDDA